MERTLQWETIDVVESTSGYESEAIYKTYTKELKQKAVALVTEQGYRVAEAQTSGFEWKKTATYYFQGLRRLIYDNSQHLELLEG